MTDSYKNVVFNGKYAYKVKLNKSSAKRAMAMCEFLVYIFILAVPRSVLSSNQAARARNKAILV